LLQAAKFPVQEVLVAVPPSTLYDIETDEILFEPAFSNTIDEAKTLLQETVTSFATDFKFTSIGYATYWSPTFTAYQALVTAINSGLLLQYKLLATVCVATRASA
jgi:hypothetical protein